MATADAQRYLQERGLPVTQANLNRVGQLMAANQIAESGKNTQDARMQAADTVSRLLGEFEQRSSGNGRSSRNAMQPTVSLPGPGTDVRSTLPPSMGAPAVGSSPAPRDVAGTPPAQIAQTPTPADYDMDLASGVAATILAGGAARMFGAGRAPVAPSPTTPAPPSNPITYTPPQAQPPAPTSTMGRTYTPPQGSVSPAMPAGNSIVRNLPGITSTAPGTSAVIMPGSVVGGGSETTLGPVRTAGSPQVNPAIQQLAARDLNNAPIRGAGGRMQPSARGQIARGTAPIMAPAGNIRPGVRSDMNSIIQNGLAPIGMMGGGGGPKLLMGLPRRQMEPLY